MKDSLTALKLLAAFLALCAVVTFFLPIDAGAANISDEFLDTLVDDEPAPLPKYATDYQLEQMQQQQNPPLAGAEMAGEEGNSKPTGNVKCPAEYDPVYGILVRWGTHKRMLTEFVVELTEQDMDVIVFVMVKDKDGGRQQLSCMSTLEDAGADMDRIRFVPYRSHSIWVGDYGPRCFWEDGYLRFMADLG